MGHERDGRWHLRKKEKKKQSRKKQRGKASGSGAEAWTTLPSADYCHSWGNLWVWGEPVGILSFFNKAWIELAHSLSLAWEMLHHKQPADNWSHACGYYHTCTFLFWIFLPRIVWDFLFASTFRQSFTHAHPHMHTHTQAPAQQSSGARLLWLKIRGGIINHKSLPLVKSGLSWCERSAVPAEQRQALAGWRARGACRGFPRHPEAYQSCGRWMDGRTMIRTRLWLRKGPPGRIFHWWRIPPFFSPPYSEMRNSWRDGGRIVQTTSVLCKLLLRRKTGFLPQHLGWQSYGAWWYKWPWAVMRVKKNASCSKLEGRIMYLDLEIQLLSIIKSRLNHWKSDEEPPITF